MTPLMHVDKHATCEGEYVKEIFYKIPELLTHHERFYDNVQKCHENWNFGVIKVGELFLNSVRDHLSYLICLQYAFEHSGESIRSSVISDYANRHAL